MVPGIVHQQSRKNDRYHISAVQYQPTERPIEDRLSVTHDENASRLVIGVYDGHGGTHTAEYVSECLSPAILKLSASGLNHQRAFQELDNVILDSFIQDYRDVVTAPHPSTGSAILPTSFLLNLVRNESPNSGKLMSLSTIELTEDQRLHAHLVKSGCAALILDVNLESGFAHWANAGDCRLVVSHDLDHGESVKNIVLETTDLNAKNSSEIERIKQAHPGEDLLVVGGRLFGRLMTTRGFGDGYYKLPLQDPYQIPVNQHRKSFLSPFLQSLPHRKGQKAPKSDSTYHKNVITLLSHPSLHPPGVLKVPLIEQYDSYFYGYRTPPYLTVMPECGEIRLRSEGGRKGASIVLMASDGLWDLVSSEEAIHIIQTSVKNRKSASGTNGPADSEFNFALHLLNHLMDEGGLAKRPGDDVTILVLLVDST